MPRVTLKMIAAKCGVSVSTVSLVLSGKGKISQQLGERIRKTAAEVGYVPNPQLAALAANRFRSDKVAELNRLALLEFPLDLAHPESSSGIYREFLREEAKRLGYDLRCIAPSESEDYAALGNELFDQGYQGLVLTGEPPAEILRSDSHWARFPIVQCGRGRQSLAVNTVRSDIFRSLKRGFLVLYERGYRRIGFGIGFHDHTLEDDEARFAAIQALQYFYLPKSDHIPCYRGRIRDKAAYTEWIRSHRPDVVIGFNDLHRWMIEDAGYRIPDDIGFVSLHLDPGETGQRRRSDSGLDPRRPVIASQSILLLDHLIRYKALAFDEAPVEVVIESAWKEGSTLPVPPRKSVGKKKPTPRKKPASRKKKTVDSP